MSNFISILSSLNKAFIKYAARCSICGKPPIGKTDRGYLNTCFNCSVSLMHSLDPNEVPKYIKYLEQFLPKPDTQEKIEKIDSSAEDYMNNILNAARKRLNIIRDEMLEKFQDSNFSSLDNIIQYFNSQRHNIYTGDDKDLPGSSGLIVLNNIDAWEKSLNLLLVNNKLAAPLIGNYLDKFITVPTDLKNPPVIQNVSDVIPNTNDPPFISAKKAASLRDSVVKAFSNNMDYNAAKWAVEDIISKMSEKYKHLAKIGSPLSYYQAMEVYDFINQLYVWRNNILYLSQLNHINPDHPFIIALSKNIDNLYLILTTDKLPTDNDAIEQALNNLMQYVSP